jgi:hypothetical protein
VLLREATHSRTQDGKVDPSHKSRCRHVSQLSIFNSVRIAIKDASVHHEHTNCNQRRPLIHTNADTHKLHQHRPFSFSTIAFALDMRACVPAQVCARAVEESALYSTTEDEPAL